MTPHTIRHIRRSLGLSQAQFAKALGTTRESVARWESSHREYNVHQAYQRLIVQLCVERGVIINDRVANWQ